MHNIRGTRTCKSPDSPRVGEGALGPVLQPVVQRGGRPRRLRQLLGHAIVNEDTVGQRVPHHVALGVHAAAVVVVEQAVHALAVLPGLPVDHEGEDLVLPLVVDLPGLGVVVGLLLCSGNGGLLLRHGELLGAGEGFLGLHQV